MRFLYAEAPFTHIIAQSLVRRFIIVVSTFAICWLPYQVYFVYVYHDTTLAKSDYAQHLFLAFYWLAMSHSMVNPLLYFWMSQMYRLYLVNWCRCACLPGRQEYAKTVVFRVDSVVGRRKSANTYHGSGSGRAAVDFLVVLDINRESQDRQMVLLSGGQMVLPPYGRSGSLLLNRQHCVETGPDNGYREETRISIELRVVVGDDDSGFKKNVRQNSCVAV